MPRKGYYQKSFYYSNKENNDKAEKMLKLISKSTGEKASHIVERILMAGLEKELGSCIEAEVIASDNPIKQAAMVICHDFLCEAVGDTVPCHNWHYGKLDELWRFLYLNLDKESILLEFESPDEKESLKAWLNGISEYAKSKTSDGDPYIMNNPLSREDFIQARLNRDYAALSHAADELVKYMEESERLYYKGFYEILFDFWPCMCERTVAYRYISHLVGATKFNESVATHQKLREILRNLSKNEEYNEF